MARDRPYSLGLNLGRGTSVPRSRLLPAPAWGGAVGAGLWGRGIEGGPRNRSGVVCAVAPGSPEAPGAVRNHRVDLAYAIDGLQPGRRFRQAAKSLN